MNALMDDPKTSRAAALRRSISALIATGKEAHPSLWAPLVLVGNGEL
jgi:CHAT domain-containing protein